VVRNNSRVNPPDEPVETHETRMATVRRAPRYGVFIGLGIVLGVIVAIALTLSFPADESVGMLPTVAYVSLYGIAAGAVLGAVVALIADRVSRSRVRVVEVERGAVEAAAEPSQLPAQAEGESKGSEE